MSIWVTGDIHGDPRRFNTGCFPEQKEMTKDDYVIILGDFGLVWDYEGESKSEEWWLDWLEERPFTTLFIDGNHENHVRLAEYPEVEFCGGKVNAIRPSVLHLKRGEIFTLYDKKFFTFGGASSHDIDDGILDPEKDAEKIKLWNMDYNKLFRVNGRSWWKEELPMTLEMEYGDRNLSSHNNKVDFVLSHCAPASTVAVIGRGMYDQDVLTRYLEEIKHKIEYDKWFFGHYHMNKQINEKEIVLYEQIVRIV